MSLNKFKYANALNVLIAVILINGLLWAAGLLDPEYVHRNDGMYRMMYLVVNVVTCIVAWVTTPTRSSHR